MVIVEGPDGSGKTTLVTALSRELNVDVHPRPCTSDGGIDMATLKDWVDQDLREIRFGPRLYDRYPLISEPIYGPAIRGRMADGFNDVLWFIEALGTMRRKTDVVLFCLPPWDFVETNVKHGHQPNTPHLEGVLKNSRALYEMYAHRCAVEATFSDPDYHVLVWDYTHHDAEDALDMLISMVERKWGR